MHPINAEAGPSHVHARSIMVKPTKPFESSRYKPEIPDGIFRVVIISTGSVASIKIPEIVGALSKVGWEGGNVLGNEETRC